jgi:flagellin-like protein
MNIPSGLPKIENRGVSPVIAVILMVAITVILSSVIGAYVLNIGDSLNESPPQASFSIEQTELPGDDAPVGVKITHTGGEEFSGRNVNAVVEGGTADIWSGTDSVKAGESAYVVAPPGGTVTVVYDTADSSTPLLSQEIDGDASSTVRSYSYDGGTYDNVRHSGFNKWSQNPHPHLSCNLWNPNGKYTSVSNMPPMIGGTCQFGNGATTQRQFDLPAGTYKVGFTAHYLRSWDNERLQVYWNNNRIWQSQPMTYNGGPTAKEHVQTFSHSGGSGTLKFSSTLSSHPGDEAWGINNVWIVKTG